MASRKPIVIDDSGRATELPAGDVLSAFRTASVALPGILAGALKDVSVTWSPAFPDASYRVTTLPVDTLLGLTVSTTAASKTASGCTLKVLNGSVSALALNTATLDVIAIHD